jgi:hypothetical protein
MALNLADDTEMRLLDDMQKQTTELQATRLSYLLHLKLKEQTMAKTELDQHLTAFPDLLQAAARDAPAVFLKDPIVAALVDQQLLEIEWNIHQLKKHSQQQQQKATANKEKKAAKVAAAVAAPPPVLSPSQVTKVIQEEVRKQLKKLVPPPTLLPPPGPVRSPAPNLERGTKPPRSANNQQQRRGVQTPTTPKKPATPLASYKDVASGRALQHGPPQSPAKGGQQQHFPRCRQQQRA